MSSVLEGVRAYLAEQESVVALVGRKIFGEKSDQWARRPTIVYTLAGGDEPGHLRGTANKARAQVQIDCWSDDKKQAEQIAEAVRDVIHTFLNGYMGDVKVRSCRLLSGPTSDWVNKEDGTDEGAFRSSIVFNIWYSVLTPSAAV